jgi:hypothetical protein
MAAAHILSRLVLETMTNASRLEEQLQCLEEFLSSNHLRFLIFQLLHSAVGVQHLFRAANWTSR